MKNRFFQTVRLAPALAVAAILVSSSGVPNATAEDDTFVRDHGSFFNLLRTDNSDLRFWGHYQPDNDADGSRGSFDLTSFGGRIEVPVAPIDEVYLRVGGEYEARMYDFQESRATGIELSSEVLHRIVGTFGAGVFLSEDLLLTGVARPGIYSNFESSVDESAFEMAGEGFVAYRVNPGTMLVAGAAYGETFDDFQLYPLAGFHVISEEGRFRVDLTFPREARIGFNVTENAQFYGGYWIDGDLYRMTPSGSSQTFDVQIQDRRVGAGFTIWLGSSVNLLAEAGMSYGSEFEIKQTKSALFSGDMKDAPYARLGLGFGF